MQTTIRKVEQER